MVWHVVLYPVKLFFSLRPSMCLEHLCCLYLVLRVMLLRELVGHRPGESEPPSAFPLGLLPADEYLARSRSGSASSRSRSVADAEDSQGAAEDDGDAILHYDPAAAQRPKSKPQLLAPPPPVMVPDALP